MSIRAYDFRHHFAYANMNRWLKEGKDVNTVKESRGQPKNGAL